MRYLWRNALDTGGVPEFMKLNANDFYNEFAFPIIGENYAEQQAFVAAGFDVVSAERITDQLSEHLVCERIHGYVSISNIVNIQAIPIRVRWRMGFIRHVTDDSLSTTDSVWEPFDSDKKWMWRKEFTMPTPVNENYVNGWHHRDVEVDVPVNRLVAPDEAIFFHIGIHTFFAESYSVTYDFPFHVQLRGLVREV